MGLRQTKVHARERTGDENVNTLNQGIIKKMQTAYSNYINRKKEEEAEKLLSKSRKKKRKARKRRKSNRKQLNKQRKPKVILTEERKN